MGEGVTSVKAGDRVAVEAGVPCQDCACRDLSRHADARADALSLQASSVVLASTMRVLPWCSFRRLPITVSSPATTCTPCHGSTPSLIPSHSRRGLCSSRWLLHSLDWSDLASSSVIRPSLRQSSRAPDLHQRLVLMRLCSGAGPIGLVTLAAAHASGACPIVITECVCFASPQPRF